MWEHTEWLFRLIAAVILAVLSLWDLKKRKIPVLVPLFLGIGAALLRGPSLAAGTLAGAIPGSLLMLVSFLFQGQIGMGDGIMAACIGMMLGGRESLETILMAFGFIFIFSCAGLMFRKLSRKACLPFVPFYFAAYIGVVYL